MAQQYHSTSLQKKAQKCRRSYVGYIEEKQFFFNFRSKFLATSFLFYLFLLNKEAVLVFIDNCGWGWERGGKFFVRFKKWGGIFWKMPLEGAILEVKLGRVFDGCYSSSSSSSPSSSSPPSSSSSPANKKKY